MRDRDPTRTGDDARLIQDTTRCCVVGSGPAGAMLGLLLARAGVDVVVLEKHADFLRDFRGDTIHPSTLEILDELGLADRFLQLPHTRISQLAIQLPSGERLDINLKRLPSKFPFIAFVPQWDFLQFVTAEAAKYPNFRLLMEAEVFDLIREDGTVTGVRYRTSNGEGQVRASVSVGADGRTSVVRQAAGLRLDESSPPMDVLWFRLSRRQTDGDILGLRLAPGRFFALINRTEYWQIAYVIPKGAFDEVRAAGLEVFRRSFAESVPELGDRVDEIHDWDQIKLLTVRADRLRRWYSPGMLCLGDAAHAMSPIAGVGINVAIQDAVEAANLLWRPLATGHVRVRDLARVQRRRELAVRIIQGFQGILQERLVRPTLRAGVPPSLPLVARIGLRTPLLRDLPARLVGLGVVRPHVRTPARG